MALVAGLSWMLAPPATAQIALGISVRFGPPPLRVLAVQPMCPGPGYIWTPGYWSYQSGGYYWVSGEWVMAPQPGMLWTPGYWGFADGVYAWHGGYWGPHVGFYGGIDYGFGYFGTGFAGGHWAAGRFYYNTAVWRVNRRVIRTTYVDRTVIRNERVNRVSFNGGPGGIRARASASEMRYSRQRRMAAAPRQGYREARPSAPARARNRPNRANSRGRQAQQRRARTPKRNQKPQKQQKTKKRKKGDKRGPGGGFSRVLPVLA
ncbi:MAG: YXWGXW repeat-containing protein [Terriglobales bacterium]